MKKTLLSAVIVLVCSVTHASENTKNTQIKVIIPQASASGLGHVFRLLDAYATKNNITLVPDFKPGAGGKIGLDYASAANGEFLLLSTISDLADNNKLTGFRNVTAINAANLVLVASTESNIKHVKDLVEIEKASPGKLKWAYTTSAQLTLVDALIDQNNLDRSKMSLIRYSINGPGPVMSVANGDVDLTFTLPNIANSLIKSNKITGVELDTDTDNKLRSKINAVGFYLPKNSQHDENYWTKFVEDFLNDPHTKTSLKASGASALPTGPENLSVMIQKWGR
jgi:tripartite-type tricarboxylate transporter receptor subunit TctC